MLHTAQSIMSSQDHPLVQFGYAPPVEHEQLILASGLYVSAVAVHVAPGPHCCKHSPSAHF